MLRLALLCAALTIPGCSSLLGIDEFKLADAGAGDDGAGGDAGRFCVGRPGWSVCLAAVPSNTLALLPPDSINTDADPRCLAAQPASWQASGQPDACFLIAATISIGDEGSNVGIPATGARPLVLVAAEAIMITGRGLDVSSHTVSFDPLGGPRGPGAPAPACSTELDAADGDPATGGPGGAGGSSGTKGGDGGQASVAGIAAGLAGETIASASKLQAGCHGGFGGSASTGADAGGLGGRGGGAIYLVAGNAIVIDGPINASGASGTAGGLHAGGGGGGSGGMIVLHAPAISSTNARGVVMANGGGGASGSGPQVRGVQGSEPSTATPTAQAPGGQTMNGGGSGGAGFAGNGAANRGIGAAGGGAGGGGGGGGGGFIVSNVPLTASSGITISPPEIAPP